MPGYFLVNIFEEYEHNMLLFNYLLKLTYINKYIIKNYKNKDYTFILKLIYNYLE